MMLYSRPPGDTRHKPMVGVLCCNEIADRPIQAVATRFIEPLVRYSGVTVVLVPAVPDALDLLPLVDRLDGLLLTGSRSNVDPARYGGSPASADDPGDPRRDEVALALAARMIEAGRPVFGICRGLQELNVLFGGTLTTQLPSDHHRAVESETAYADLFEHRHDVDLTPGGLLAGASAVRRLSVNSVHHQGIDRLGGGLRVEAIACDDGLVEAFSARPCGGQVLAVQWHPEWDARHHAPSRAFFELIGAALAAPRAASQSVM
jgi:gamma-glutamyl-gamma-aminobutyrate hydrolase PuuD